MVVERKKGGIEDPAGGAVSVRRAVRELRRIEEVRERLARRVQQNPSDEELQRLIEIAARCVSEAAAWEAYARALGAEAETSFEEVRRLEGEAHAAKRIRIGIVERLREDIEDGKV